MSEDFVAIAFFGAIAAGWSVHLMVAPGSWHERLRGDQSRRGWRRVRRGLDARLPCLASALVSGVLAYGALGLIAPALVIAALGWSATAALRRWRDGRRAARLGAALLGAVDLMAQLLPAGHSTRQSLVVLADSGPAELRGEIAQIVSRVNDIPLDEALIEAQERMQQPLFTLIAAALIVGNRSGGRLAPLLQELSRAAHQLDAVQGQLRAEQSQGRLGALVIAVMPIGLLALVHLVNPEYLAPYKTVGGELLLGSLVAVIALGYLWMVRILRLAQPDVLTVAPDGRRDGFELRSRPYSAPRRSPVPTEVATGGGRHDGEDLES